MELDRYWLGVTGPGWAVPSRPDQSDLGSPPVHAACSSLPTRITSPMVGFVGIHGMDGAGAGAGVPPGVPGDVFQP